jgi:hypothetical protein
VRVGDKPLWNPLAVEMGKQIDEVEILQKQGTVGPDALGGGRIEDGTAVAGGIDGGVVGFRGRHVCGDVRAREGYRGREGKQSLFCNVCPAGQGPDVTFLQTSSPPSSSSSSVQQRHHHITRLVANPCHSSRSSSSTRQLR